MWFLNTQSTFFSFLFFLHAGYGRTLFKKDVSYSYIFKRTIWNVIILSWLLEGRVYHHTPADILLELPVTHNLSGQYRPFLPHFLPPNCLRLLCSQPPLSLKVRHRQLKTPVGSLCFQHADIKYIHSLSSLFHFRRCLWQSYIHSLSSLGATVVQW